MSILENRFYIHDMLHRTRTFAQLLFCLLIFACQGRNPEQQADHEETSAVQDSSNREDALPLLKEEDLRVVPTMASVFQEGNAVHCSNAEYLWHALRGHADRDLSHHVLANEFNQSKTWKNTLDTNRLILALGKPDEVYKKIVQ